MTDSNDTRSTTAQSDRPVTPPLKAERIQWLLLGLDLGNRPYDFANETDTERAERLDAGWIKRTSATRPAKPDAA